MRDLRDLCQNPSQLLAEEVVRALDSAIERLGRELRDNPAWVASLTGSQREGLPSGPAKPTLKPPSQDDWVVYFYQCNSGKKQTALANDPILMERLGRKVDQGTISRMLKRVNEWLKAGGKLPEQPEPLTSKPTPMDPERIELGPNPEHRPKHQRNRQTSDGDD
jgi:hypothetical protein